MSKMLYTLGGWVARNRIKAICAWIVVLVAAIGLAVTLKPSFLRICPYLTHLRKKRWM